MPSRRTALATCIATVGTAMAGCLANRAGDTVTSTSTRSATDSTATSTCTASDPPAPTEAAAPPHPYPEQPTNLTKERLEAYLEAYETAYQYNKTLLRYPDKYGRTNELTVYVRSVSVESEGDRFTAVVSGYLQTGILDATDANGSDTPTRSPLPMGHKPFEASYEVTDRKLRRESTVVECWKQ